MPELTQPTFDLALQHHQAGRLAEAESLYRQILAVDPHQPEALHYLGVLAHQVGRHEVASELIGQALAIRPAWPEALSNQGEALRAQGQFEAAAACFQRAIELAPEFAAAHNNLGNALKAQGQFDLAIAAYQQAIVLKPEWVEALNNLAIVLNDNGQVDEAITTYQRAIALKPDLVELHYNLGNAWKDTGKFDQAIVALRQAIALQPERAENYYSLGVTLYNKGEKDEALAAYQQAITLKPDYFEAYNNLAIVLKDKGLINEAIAAYQQAIALNPNMAEAYFNLGVTFYDQGQLDQAICAYQHAITLQPEKAEYYYNLGIILYEQGQYDQSIAAYQQAIAFKPQWAEPQNNIGAVLIDQGHFDEAILAFHKAIAIKHDLAAAHNNLGHALKEKGELEAAIANQRQAHSLNPKDMAIFSNLLLSLHYSTEVDNSTLAAELARWDELYAPPLCSNLAPHLNDRSLNRRLRIGYFSSDLRNHSVGRFLLPLLENHDRAQYEIFAYAQVPVPDDFSERLRAHTDVWRSTVGLSDAQLAELIRADQIDILVDLAMHTANNRLLVFAHKPAPVQVNYLAYVGSTGLTTMDYRLSDPYLDPLGIDESIYSEKTVRLPETYWCYRPTDNIEPRSALDVSKDFITFGCLNNSCKINPPLFKVWAQILQEVPYSRLILHAYQGDHRQRMLDRFAQLGIDACRIEFVDRLPRTEYFQMYQSLDITLDTTPYAGGTTTCDSLWMGVPVVTLAGKRAVGRGGVSILSNVGLPELIAQTPEEYIQIAVALANDQPRLHKLRATLRQRMQASPLMDASKFTRDVEAAYRTMWHKWCEKS